MQKDGGDYDESFALVILVDVLPLPVRRLHEWVGMFNMLNFSLLI